MLSLVGCQTTGPTYTGNAHYDAYQLQRRQQALQMMQIGAGLLMYSQPRPVYMPPYRAVY